MCSPLEVERYLSRVSGPLLDRIDIHIEVPAVPYRELSVDRSGEPSAAISERVNGAREVQLEWFATQDGVYAKSARAYHRVLKIARTIADLADSTAIESAHVSEPVQYRSLDRPLPPRRCVT